MERCGEEPQDPPLITGPEAEELETREIVHHPYPRVSLAHLTEITYIPGNKWHHKPKEPKI